MPNRPIDETVAEMVDVLEDNQREMFEERAAIREHDGGTARDLAEALAILDVLDCYPEALNGLVVFQIDIDEQPRFFVATSKELLRKHAEKVGGDMKARRTAAWAVEHELGGIAELVVAA